MEKVRINIMAISGSTKRNSTSNSILNFIKELYRETIDFVIYDKIGDLPHFNPELDNERVPRKIIEFREIIENSDGVLFCTPEYVFSIPGSLKNAIEWNVSTTVFSSKPVAIIIAAASGEKAFESLDLIMTTIESILPDTSKLLIRGAKGKLDDKKQLKDTYLIQEITRVVDSLINTINNSDKIPTKYIE